jgi:putative DNA-invertase from lambdoid prophage Rac
MSRSAYWRVSVIAMNGLAFDLSTPHGRMMATIIAGIADLERELLQERIRSGIAAAKARGKRLGRQPGQRPKSDRLTPKVLALVAEGRSYRLIGRELGLSKNNGTEPLQPRAEAPHAASTLQDRLRALTQFRIRAPTRRS